MRSNNKIINGHSIKYINSSYNLELNYTLNSNNL